jgi:N-acetylneuraminic acid mutarotase
MRRACLVVLALSALVVLATVAPAVASPVYDVKVSGHLPSAVYRAASVDTGDAVYLFGGRNESTTTAAVVKYDKETGMATPAGWSLPGPRMSACAVYDGKYAYVFGGADGGTELDTILKIDLAAGEVRTLDARLPSPRIGLSAAMFGQMAYLFGGHSNGTMITAILRFDPSSGNLSLMGASLPAGLAGMGAAPDARGIFLFGGNTGSGGTDRVMLYEPARDALTVLPKRLPYPVFHAPAVAFEGRILLVGGSGQLLGWEVSRATDSVVEFDPASGKSRTLQARLPSPNERSSAAVSGGKVLVFGGQQGVSALDDIVAISSVRAGQAGGPATWIVVMSIVLLTCVAVLAFAAGRPR